MLYSRFHNAIVYGSRFFLVEVDSVCFKGYVDFFLLQDCVDEKYNVLYGLDTPLFVSMPKTLNEYHKWIDSEIDFVTKRGRRIEDYIHND